MLGTSIQNMVYNHQKVFHNTRASSSRFRIPRKMPKLTTKFFMNSELYGSTLKLDGRAVEKGNVVRSYLEQTFQIFLKIITLEF